MGRLVGVLSHLGGVLRRLEAVLSYLGVVWGRLGSVLQAPERETMNFQWFWEVFGGGAPRACQPDAGIVRPPKSRFFKTDQTPLELGKGKGNGLGQGQAHGPGLGCLVFNTHSRRRAKRGGGYSTVHAVLLQQYRCNSTVATVL